MFQMIYFHQTFHVPSIIYTIKYYNAHSCSIEFSFLHLYRKKKMSIYISFVLRLIYAGNTERWRVFVQFNTNCIK